MLLCIQVGRLSAQLRTAAAVVHMTRCALSSCLKVVSSKETADVSEDVDLDVALMCMKVGRITGASLCV